MNKFKALSLMCAAAMLFSTHTANADDHFWSHHEGGPDADYSFDVAANAAGNTAFTGYFFGDYIVDGDTLTSLGASDIIISNYNTAGAHVWSKALGSTGNDAGLGVCVDPDGAVIVTGYFEGTVDFGGGPLVSAGSTDIFIVKYGPLGNHVWNKQFGGAAGGAGADIAVNAAGTCAVTGISSGTIDFGGGAIIGLGGNDMFVAVFSADGSHVWSDVHGGIDSDTGWRIDVDETGAVAVAGYFKGSADVGGGSMISAGNNDIFVARYDAGGTHMWSDHYGAAGDDRPQGIAFNSTSEVAFTGTFVDSVDFGGGNLGSVNSDDIFLAQHDAGGNHLWSQRFGGIGADKVYGLDVDALDQVVITGGFPNDIDFGGGTHSSVGFDDVFVAKFDNSGTWVWSERFGGSGDDKGRGVAVDGYQNIAISGTFETTIDFGGGLLVNPGIFNFDVFIAKFRPSAATGIARNSPTAPVLHQNYPNPFNPTTRISFSLLSAEHVLLRVYDVRGELVRTLLERTMDEGTNTVEWDGRDDSGRSVGSGIYFYRLDTSMRSLAKKMVLLK